MRISVARGAPHQLICTVECNGASAVITSAEPVDASLQLLEAIDDARRTGYGECFWNEPTGMYRWMLRRTGDRLTVVALWCAGTVPGWQHVLHAETAFDTFAQEMSGALAAVCTPSA